MSIVIATTTWQIAVAIRRWIYERAFWGANVTKEMKNVCFLLIETAQKVGSREFELNEDLRPE